MPAAFAAAFAALLAALYSGVDFLYGPAFPGGLPRRRFNAGGGGGALPSGVGLHDAAAPPAAQLPREAFESATVLPRRDLPPVPASAFCVAESFFCSLRNALEAHRQAHWLQRPQWPHFPARWQGHCSASTVQAVFLALPAGTAATRSASPPPLHPAMMRPNVCFTFVYSWNVRSPESATLSSTSINDGPVVSLHCLANGVVTLLPISAKLMKWSGYSVQHDPQHARWAGGT